MKTKPLLTAPLPKKDSMHQETYSHRERSYWALPLEAKLNLMAKVM